MDNKVLALRLEMCRRETNELVIRIAGQIGMDLDDQKSDLLRKKLHRLKWQKHQAEAMNLYREELIAVILAEALKELAPEGESTEAMPDPTPEPEPVPVPEEMTADAPQETEEPGEVIDAALHSADSPPQANNVPDLGKIQPEDLESLMRPEVHAETAAMIREANALSRRKR